MANPNWNINPWDTPWDTWTKGMDDKLRVTEHVIQGEMLMASVSMSELQEMTSDIATAERNIKIHLANLIAEELLSSKFISFSKKKEGFSGRTIYLARAYLVPADMVQILKQVK